MNPPRICRLLLTAFCMTGGLISGAAIGRPGVLSSSIAATAATPQGLIEGLHGALIEVMRDAKRLGPKGRFDKLRQPVVSTLDLEGMLKIAVGDYWAQASAAEREKLLAAFRDYSVSSFASRFDGYSGERFETLGTAPGPRGTVLVRTRILGPSTDPVPITYVVRQSADEWHVIDILLEAGISELATRRSEYRAILKDGGMAELAAVLEQKARNLTAP